MTFWRQRRVPITKGWGPCKRTHWVPVNEHYSHQGLDGITRTWDWEVGIDAGAFAPPRGVFLPDDTRYLGFRELRPGRPGWLWRERIRNERLSNLGFNEILDEILARDLQEDEDRRALSERRTDEFRARWLELHDQQNAIHDRSSQHIQAFMDNMAQPISDDRLTGLRAEAAIYDERRRQREEEQSRRDRARERELRDAAVGRQTREDLDGYGFVPVGRRRVRW